MGQTILAPVDLGIQGGKTGALLAGKGTSANPFSSATADKNDLAFYTKRTATSGSTRQYYGRLDVNGAGQNAECLRARAIANVAGVGDLVGGSFAAQVGTANATATVTGLAAGVRSSIDLASATAPGGTFYGLLVESISAVDSQAPTRYALIGARTLANGTAGAGTKCITLLALGDTEGAVSTGTGDTTMLKTGGTFGCSGGIGVLINGVRAYIPYGSIST